MRPAIPGRAFGSAFELDDAQKSAIELLTRGDRYGVYMWGPVGRGKTWLLDRYFDAAPTPKKRVHFHSFFRDLHASYFRHGFSLEKALNELLGHIELLCFDEFHVHDIGDARLISRMLDALFAREITLVTTSNYPPDGLLPNPLFHDAFVPTIELLKSKLRIVPVDGPVDYRTQASPAAEITASMSRTSGFASGTWSVGTSTEGVSFAELCDSPKSTSDYLTIIQEIEDLTITAVPALKATNHNAVQRFSNLVDVLYDGDVRTYFYSSVPLEEFADGCNGLDIERICSRLSQLQTFPVRQI